MFVNNFHIYITKIKKLKNVLCYGFMALSVEFVVTLDFLSLHTRRRVVVGEN